MPHECGILWPDSIRTDSVIRWPLAMVIAQSVAAICLWGTLVGSMLPLIFRQLGFDPGYAVDFWDITNRQDWGACESVQRGLASEHAKPGPLAPDEDAVYQYVTMIGRGYRGEPVWNRADSTWVTEQVVS